MIIGSSEKQSVFVLIAAAVLVRLIFVFSTPAWQSPDEFPHYWVANEIKTTHQLPYSLPEFPRYEAYQPPIYYTVCAIILANFEEPLHYSEFNFPPTFQLIVLRLFSVLFGLIFLWFSYKILEQLSLPNSETRLLGLSFICFLPTLTGAQSSVNNDAPVIMTSAISLYYLTKQDAGNQKIIWSSFWTGLSVLVKVSAFILPVVIIFYILLMGHPDKWKKIKQIAISSSIIVLFSSILVIRNLIQYDQFFGINPGQNSDFNFSFSQLIWALRNLSWSFVFAFGKLYQIHLHPFIYIAGLISISVPVLFGWRKRVNEQLRLVLFLVFSILCAVMLSLIYTLSYNQGAMTSWGKNIFPVLPLIAVFLANGMSSLFKKFTNYATAAISTGFLVSLVYAVILLNSLI